jgi:hypothetical protein
LRSIVISPGPGHPQTDSGISRDVVKWATGKVPLLGVCMGLECVVDAMGGEVGSFWMLGQPPSNHWPPEITSTRLLNRLLSLVRFFTAKHLSFNTTLSASSTVSLPSSPPLGTTLCQPTSLPFHHSFK